MIPLPLPLFGSAPQTPVAAPVARPGPAAGSLVRVEGLEGSWRVRRAGEGWVEVVGLEGFRTVEAERVRSESHNRRGVES